MYRTILILAFTLMFGNCMKGQAWKHDQNSLVLSLGISHFMGDLGGGAKDAAHFFGVRDLDFAATRPVVKINYRYKVNKSIAVKAGVGWAILAANDKYSTSVGRNLRNLHFKTNLFSANLHGEYYFLKEHINPRYLFSNKHSVQNFSAYLFTGLSLNMFNPKAKLNGEWYELQPLGTEGQGIDGNPAPYKKIAFGIPIGLGVRYLWSRKITIGIELSNTYTTSDYIDDAHDSYFDNDKIKNTYGEEAALLADRHIGYDGNPHTAPKPSGHKMRGNPKYNDAFLYTVITLTYNLKKDKRGLPKFH